MINLDRLEVTILFIYLLIFFEFFFFQAENPTAISRSNSSGSEGYPTSLPTTNNQEGRTVPCRTFPFFFFLFYLCLIAPKKTVDFQILEEKRETPILENTVPAASKSRDEGQVLTLPAVPTTIPRSTYIPSVTLDSGMFFFIQ